MKTTVSERGQVTIPKRLRDRLGIRPGQKLEVHEERGRLVFTKAVSSDVWDSVVGIVKEAQPTDEIMRGLRGDRDDLLP